jgi:hypothetical protein
LHRDSAEAAGLLVAAELRELVDIDDHIPRHEEINVAIAVVVRPCCARAEPASAHAGSFCDIVKLAAAKASIQGVAAISGYVEILHLVVVVIGDGDAHAPPFAGDA